MATLVQLSAAQVFTLASTSGDSSGQIGSWTVDALTRYNTNAPSVNNQLLLAFNEATTLITDAGLNPASLTDLQLSRANRAMAFAVAYKLISNDIGSAQTMVGENFTDTTKSTIGRAKHYWSKAGLEYKALGVGDDANPYWVNESYQNFAEVTPQNATNWA